MTRKGITKDQNLVRQLARKAFLEAETRILENNIKQLEQALTKTRDLDAASMIRVMNRGTTKNSAPTEMRVSFLGIILSSHMNIKKCSTWGWSMRSFRRLSSQDCNLYKQSLPATKPYRMSRVSSRGIPFARPSQRSARILSSEMLPITAKAKSMANIGTYDPVFVNSTPDRVATNDVGINVRLVMLKLSA